MHVYLSVMVFASVIGLLRAGIGNAVSFHFLGATAMTLLFGWPLALIALSVVIPAFDDKVYLRKRDD